MANDLKDDLIRFKETKLRKKKFKAKCKANGNKTISEVLCDFVTKYINRK